MKFLLVLVGLATTVHATTADVTTADVTTVDMMTTTRPSCYDNHRPSNNPHKYEVSDLEGNWEEKWCHPRYNVFFMEENCSCRWTFRTIYRPSQASPDKDYMYEFWHTGLNVWVERDCHDVFPKSLSGPCLFWNQTRSRCDWKRGHIGCIARPQAIDCALKMDIEMNKQPPRDAKGSSVQAFNPDNVWPQTVPLRVIDGRDAVCFNDTRLKLWYLSGNSHQNIWLYFGLLSGRNDDPDTFEFVLSDACRRGVEFSLATFQFWYRANPMAFLLEYKGTFWECNPGGNGIDVWNDVALFFAHGRSPKLFINNNLCSLHVRGNPRRISGVFLVQRACHLNLGGNELIPYYKYTGCMSRFQVMYGLDCPIRGSP